MISTDLIDIIYETRNSVLKYNETIKDFSDFSKTYKSCQCNDDVFVFQLYDGMFKLVFSDGRALTCMYNNSYGNNLTMMTSRKTVSLIGFKCVERIKYYPSVGSSTARSINNSLLNYTEYYTPDLLNLSTEARFYHELNSPTEINDLIFYNDYITEKNYDPMYKIQYTYNVPHELLKNSLLKLQHI